METLQSIDQREHFNKCYFICWAEANAKLTKSVKMWLPEQIHWISPGIRVLAIQFAISFLRLFNRSFDKNLVSLSQRNISQLLLFVYL